MDAPNLPPPGFDNLPIEQRLAYVQQLWDRIASSASELPVPDWHRDEIARRLQNAR